MIDIHLGFLEPILVTSVQGGQTGIAFPFAPVYEAAQLKLVRANLFLQSLSVAAAAMNVEICIQLSDDGANWPTSTTAPSAGTSVLSFATVVARQSEGFTAITSFEDITALLTKKYVRFVVFVKNTAGNVGLGTCLAAIRIERKTC